MGGGKFITLEGGEGAGKSTQARLLHTALEAQGIETLTTREPGGAPGAEAIRGLLLGGEPGHWEPLSEALLHNAARHEHVVRTIAPALAAGRWVVCDRFVDSTVAYQGCGQGVADETLAVLQRLAVGELAPDLTLVLDIPVAAGQARIDARAKRGGGGPRIATSAWRRAFTSACARASSRSPSASPGAARSSTQAGTSRPCRPKSAPPCAGASMFEP